jgi:hypothetical protein
MDARRLGLGLDDVDDGCNGVVWQYGHTDVASTRRGFLNTPDGLDFIPLDALGRPL